MIIAPVEATGPHTHRVGIGIALLCVGLLGHLLAAHSLGGSRVAYTHHIAGFVLLTVVSGVVLAGLGLRFWRGRQDITLLSLGAVQAVLGLLIFWFELA